jgi:hypothetical protein
MKQHQISKLSAQTTAQQTDSEVVFAPEEDCEPDSPECRSANAFLEALARGDAPAVARGLRKMKQLDGVALEILADHFEGKPTPELIYPFILKFVRRRRGKPVDAWSHAKPLARALAVNCALKTNRKKEAAVAEEMEKTGLSRSTIFKALRKQTSPKAGPGEVS